MDVGLDRSVTSQVTPRCDLVDHGVFKGALERTEGLGKVRAETRRNNGVLC